MSKGQGSSHWYSYTAHDNIANRLFTVHPNYSYSTYELFICLNRVSWQIASCVRTCLRWTSIAFTSLSRTVYRPDLRIVSVSQSAIKRCKSWRAHQDELVYLLYYIKWGLWYGSIWTWTLRILWMEPKICFAKDRDYHGHETETCDNLIFIATPKWMEKPYENSPNDFWWLICLFHISFLGQTCYDNHIGPELEGV